MARPNVPYLEAGGEHAPFLPTGGAGGIPPGGEAGQALGWGGPGVAVWETPKGGPPSGAAGGDLTGLYPSPTIAANAVTTAKLSVLAREMLEHAVQSGAAGVISTAMIAALAITEGLLAAESVSEAKLTAALAAKLNAKANLGVAYEGLTERLTGAEWTPSATEYVQVLFFATEVTTSLGNLVVNVGLGTALNIIMKMSAGETVFAGSILVPPGKAVKVTVPANMKLSTRELV